MRSLLGILSISLLTVLLYSCSQKTIEEVEKKHPNGTKMLVKTYIIKGEDKVLLKEQEFYSNEQLRREGNFKDGKRTGEWNAFYEDGTLWSKGFFENDKRQDSAWVYHSNGKLFYRGLYQNGAKSGLWYFYNDLGQEEKTVSYENNKLIKEEFTNKENH